MLHNNMNILSIRLLSPNVLERVCLISQEVKDNTCQYFKIIREIINLTLYA